MKTKEMKKALLFLLLLVMSISMVSGCSQKNVQNDTSGLSSTEKADTGESDDGENTADAGIMRDMTAQEIVNEMTIGWNLGDTLDVCNADRNGDGQADETAEEVDETLWGNVRTTKELFVNLKKDGINAVRIPVTWRDHLGDAPEYQIDEDWMNRVEEVVRYAYEEEMYVIINVHHDGGGDPDFGAWIRNASNSEEKDVVLEKYTAIWKQIAERFINYSDYLIFESMNEVGFDDLESEDAYALLNELNQTFVDVVRKTGGNNAERHLLIAGYWTDIEATCNDLFQMPEDTVSDRLILSVHYYTPWEFCTTNIQNTWGSAADRKLMHEKIDAIHEKFTENGIPVIIGEYGFGGGNDKASCIYFTENLVKYCHDRNIATFLWDNGQCYDRTSMQWRLDGLPDALQRAVSGEDYKITKQK